MGAGIAKAVKNRFPAAYQADLATKKGDPSKLGTISFAEVAGSEGPLFVVNAYTQLNYGRGKGRLVDYDAVRRAFAAIRTQFSGRRIGYPRIGAGLAGGDWGVIARIIDEELEGEDHTLVEFRQ
jgi:O-acetyl-ADP-ribose deacetylase (regulator of RNase III)